MLSSSSWPSFQEFANAFVNLSYLAPKPDNLDSFQNSNYYGVGPLDACFIISTIAVFAVCRDIVRLRIMTPFANKILFGHFSGWKNPSKRTNLNGNGHAKPISNGNRTNGTANGNSHYAVRKISAKNRVRERNVIRFAEQGWSLVYYTIWWCFGLYIHFSLPHSPWNLDYLWIGIPHSPLPGPVKAYYLTQCASWIHQLLILNAEEHRKDHVQMMSHHIITICLVLASYSVHLTRVGCLVLVLMDFCDIILALAKMLRYMERLHACDIAFVVFIVSWFLTRHVGFLLILYSTWVRFPILRPQTFDPTRDDPYKEGTYYTFNALLAALQVIMCIWFISIIRVAYNVISGKPAEDVRSDDEELPDSSDEEGDEEPHEKKSK